MQKKVPSYILPVIVFSQFAGTSLWFAGNAVINDLIEELLLISGEEFYSPEAYVGYVTMAVQTGFIIGTLLFAFMNVADRFSPVKVFLFCAVAGAIANLSLIWSTDFYHVIEARVVTGFFLAGIYPVGMKIASDWHKEGLGKALGYLVSALVIGTAFPHLLKYLGGELPWRYVIMGTSILAAVGGLATYFFVGDGPFHIKSEGFKFDARVILKLFGDRNFRSAALGYFGHMWELYTFWALVPVFLAWYNTITSGVGLDVPFWSFLIIGIGGISCVIGGYLSLNKGSKWVAKISLAGSGLSCLLLPFAFEFPPFLFLTLLFIWGFFVIPDSPQFSTLVARSADSSYVATGLTIVNSIGFALTIVSIHLVNYLWFPELDVRIYWVILIGPILGYFSIRRFKTAE